MVKQCALFTWLSSAHKVETYGLLEDSASDAALLLFSHFTS
jgi:hypothetical protein